MQHVQAKVIRFFTVSAGVLLLALATAMIIANWASAGLTQPHDQILLVPMQYLFWIASAAELVMSLICFFGDKIWLKQTFIFLLAANFWVYHLAYGNGLSGYLGSLADAFGVSPHTAELILEIAFLYLLIGSSCSWLLFPMKENQGYLKIACAHCGGHIVFYQREINQNIKCPHCAATIVLQVPTESLSVIPKATSASP